MRKVVIAAMIMMCLSLGLEALSIYEVQYSSMPGNDGTYPSRYVGKKVTLDGIVTASDFHNNGFFLNEAVNGPWRGILIMDAGKRVQQGDRVVVTGEVSEYYGMTCLTNLSSLRIIASGVSLPLPLTITTGQLAGADEAEAYEGVYTRVLNTTVAGTKGAKGSIQITDGSGACYLNSTLVNGKVISGAKSNAGTQYASLTGIVVYGFSAFTLSPVNPGDLVPLQPTFIQNRSWGTIKSIYK